jgi:hypothetical protein
VRPQSAFVNAADLGDGVPKDQLEVESDKNKAKKKRGKKRQVEETLDEEEKNAEMRDAPPQISSIQHANPDRS